VENQIIENLLQDISGIASHDAFFNEKILIYAEVASGMISSSFFFRDPTGNVIYRFSSKGLKDTIYNFWEKWRRIPGNREWRCMTYAIENGEFTVEFKYPDEIDDEKVSSDRRPAVILEHFGDVEVDYSNPE
jgi:hypothetical protein